MVKGTVTISLESYHKLIEESKRFDAKKGNLLRSAKELGVFLAFLASRSNIEQYVEEFNRQSETASIVFEGSIAKIKFKEDEEKNNS